MDSSRQLSIKSYYKDKVILITGASGFVGRFLVYKILNSLDVRRIYILLRGKKGRSFSDRLEEYKKLELFSFLPDPSLIDKITAIEGDVCYPDLNLSTKDLQKVKNEVNIVFHSAATIRFNESLKTATKLHVSGTQNVVQLCREMKRFEIFVHISSIGTWSANKTLEEEVPESPFDPLEFAKRVESMTEVEAEKLESELIGRYEDGKWLNTYSLTKSLAEKVASTSDLPKVAIVRPPFLMSPIKEPQIGWFDTPQSAVGLTAMYSFGILRVAQLRVQTDIELIPVDMCVNGLLCATWYQRNRNEKRVDAYNMTSSEAFPFQGREVLQEGISLGYQYPSVKQIRPPVQMYHMSPSKHYVRVKDFFTHTLFCMMIDLIMRLMGRKAFLYSLTRKSANAISYIFETTSNYKSGKFILRSGKLSSISRHAVDPSEREEFSYDPHAIPWKKLALESHLRFRRHVLKEPDSTLEYARRRLRIVCSIYQLFKALTWLSLAFVAFQLHVLLLPVPLLWVPFAASVSYLLAIFLIQ